MGRPNAHPTDHIKEGFGGGHRWRFFAEGKHCVVFHCPYFRVHSTYSPIPDSYPAHYTLVGKKMIGESYRQSHTIWTGRLTKEGRRAIAKAMAEYDRMVDSQGDRESTTPRSPAS